MADTQFEVATRQYARNLDHLYEDFDRPYLIDTFTFDGEVSGKTKYYGRIGRMTGNRKESRNEEVKYSDAEFSGRHLQCFTDYVAAKIDRDDVIRAVDNLQDDIYIETMNALNDMKTALAMGGFFASVVTGENAGTTSAFPTANVVSVAFSAGRFGQNSSGNDVGLNLDKLLKVRSLLSNAGVRPNSSSNNMIQIAVCEDDVQSLLSSQIGTDNFPMLDQFNQFKVNLGSAYEKMTGAMFHWYGMDFHVIPPEFFLLDSSGNRRLPVWLKSGMTYGVQIDVDAEIVRLPDTVESTKVQVLTKHGVLRKHDKKVYDIRVTV